MDFITIYTPQVVVHKYLPPMVRCLPIIDKTICSTLLQTYQTNISDATEFFLSPFLLLSLTDQCIWKLSYDLNFQSHFQIVLYFNKILNSENAPCGNIHAFTKLNPLPIPHFILQSM